MSAMPPDWRVVLQIDTPAQAKCFRFADLPVDPAHIQIVAEEPGASADASRLFAHLVATLVTLAPTASPPMACSGCMARDEATCQSVLVVVCGANAISGSLTHLITDWQTGRPLRSAVVPILPAGAQPGSILPPPLDRIVALFLANSIEMLVPDVLRAALI